MYCAVPITCAVWVIVAWLPLGDRAIPKSMTLTSLRRVTITLDGLMSRCTMPLR
jgi:hypothetical protein